MPVLTTGGRVAHRGVRRSVIRSSIRYLESQLQRGVCLHQHRLCRCFVILRRDSKHGKHRLGRAQRRRLYQNIIGKSRNARNGVVFYLIIRRVSVGRHRLYSHSVFRRVYIVKQIARVDPEAVRPRGGQRLRDKHRVFVLRGVVYRARIVNIIERGARIVRLAQSVLVIALRSVRFSDRPRRIYLYPLIVGRQKDTSPIRTVIIAHVCVQRKPAVERASVHARARITLDIGYSERGRSRRCRHPLPSQIVGGKQSVRAVEPQIVIRSRRRIAVGKSLREVYRLSAVVVIRYLACRDVQGLASAVAAR